MDKEKRKDMEHIFQEIIQKMEKIMGHETKIRYNSIDEIKSSPSGKFLFVFSKVKKI